MNSNEPDDDRQRITRRRGACNFCREKKVRCMFNLWRWRAQSLTNSLLRKVMAEPRVRSVRFAQLFYIYMYIVLDVSGTKL
jgi:hypothetical protein